MTFLLRKIKSHFALLTIPLLLCSSVAFSAAKNKASKALPIKSTKFQLTVGMVNADNTVTYIPKKQFALAARPYSEIYKEFIDESKDMAEGFMNCDNFKDFTGKFKSRLEYLNALTNDVDYICETDLKGTCNLSIPVEGMYSIFFVWPVSPLLHNGEFFHWDKPIKIYAGKPFNLELSNDNTSDHPSMLFYRIQSFMKDYSCEK